MSEPNESKEQQRDPADILADMADKEPEEIAPPQESEQVPDPLEALDLMSRGSSDPAEDMERLAQPGVEGTSEDFPLPPDDAGQGGFRARRARTVIAARGEVRANVHAYKQTIIPFLLVVAGLLLLVGVASLVMMLSASKLDRQYSAWYSYIALVVMVSFPLAAVLTFGAWWFHRETKGR